jgi:LPXTG-site transpeptidase (sortase) family protein
VATTPRKRRLTPLDCLFLVLGLCLVGYALVYISSWYGHTHGTAPPPNPRHVVTVSSPTPDEKPVPRDAAYDVAADQPKRLRIPTIDLDGFIERVSRDRQGAIGTPSNVHYAGWFTGSARPGDPGLSLIDGHVSGRYGSALFARLGDLRTGDTVTVQFGDDSLRDFQIVDKRTLSTEQAGQFLLQKRDDIDRQLNLVTCGGRFDKHSRQYNQRVVVVAKRLE